MKKIYYSYDNTPKEAAYKRTTHLAISAHQDDIEFMAYQGILECFGKKDKWFGAVIVSDGSGSPRNGLYQNYTDEQMRNIRVEEQKKAAFIGEYSFLKLLGHTSADIKNKNFTKDAEDLSEILLLTKPQILYTHNPADRHDTHIATLLKTIKALRMLDKKDRPQKLFGCEVWRSLDWVINSDKIITDVSNHSNLANALSGVFDSQIAGGKRYDTAIEGRRKANATFSEGHQVDTFDSACYSIDMTQLIKDDNISISEYISFYINNFKEDILNRINKYN